MTRREYQCSRHGYFEVRRPISAPTKENCSICHKQAERIYTEVPSMGMKGEGIGQPDFHLDEKEYKGWQQQQFATYDEKLHPDNVGKTLVDYKQLTEKTATGKRR